MKAKLRTLFALLFVSVLAVTDISSQALAQSDNVEWATPVNLSQSGAASSPVIVLVPDGTMRVFWWDEFDGTMVADGVPVAPVSAGVGASEAETELETPSSARDAWSAPRLATLQQPVTVSSTGEEAAGSVAMAPKIVGDTSGRAHAFWLGEPDEDTGYAPLLHSYLNPGSTTWSTPATLAEAALSLDATADISGAVHVAYVQPVQIAGSPIGLYYRQSRNAGTWSRATAIQQSRYLRLLPAEGDSVSLTAEDSERVYATWHDPHRDQVLVAHSADGGSSWQEPRTLVPSDGTPLQHQMLALPGQVASILWEPADQDQSLLSLSSAEEALLLTVWDGARWSETRRLRLHLQDPELGELLHLTELQLALARAFPDQEQAGQTLVAVGVDQNQDLWITGTQTEVLERLSTLSAEPSPSQFGDSQNGASQPVPANLSRSGLASSPTIVAGSDGTLWAFWRDQFDGLMVADGSVSASSVLSGTQEIVTTHDFWSEPRPVSLPASNTPQILADATGEIHAFWIQEPPREQQAIAKVEAWPLRYSRLTSDATAWLSAVTLAESAVTFDVATDASGALHLAYVQTVDSPSSPAGVYYRRTGEEGITWLAPVALDQSRYLRLLSPETAHIRLAADDKGGVYVTWDDPRLEELLLVYSPDGGRTWKTPRLLGDSEAQPRRGRFVVVPGDEILLLWEDTGFGVACSLYQAPAAALFTGSTGFADRVLEELTMCPENTQYLLLGGGQILMVAGGGTDSLTLAAWNGEQWSEPSRLSYSFEDPEVGRQVYLSNLQAVLVALPGPSREGGSGQALVAVGTDQEGDVWASSSQMGMLDMVFALPSPWSAPARLTDGEGSPNLPAMAADAEGRLHVLWSENAEGPTARASLLYTRRDQVATASGTEVRWTGPAEILPSPDGRADQPFLLALGSQLHAVWRGGQEGEILYSQAFAGDAYTASGWQEPQILPALATPGSWPHLAADLGGTLHVVYAVPVNEERGIYYTRSQDGQNWSEARQVFDAAGAGWAMSDYPRLAVDLAGTIHAVWVRADPLGSGLSQAIYYARSLDSGETWSEPLEVVEGAYAWPEVIATGTDRVHLLWDEATGENAWWHQWSADGGVNWTRPERVPGFGNVPGPAGALADGSAKIHLVGLGQDAGKPALLYMTWEGQRWGERDTLRLALAVDESVPGVSTALLPAQGQLDVVFRGEGEGEDGAKVAHLWYTGRAIPAVVVTPVPTITPRPTSTPLPTPVPMTLATPTPSFGVAPPQSSSGSMAELLPLLLSGGLAVALVAGAFGVRVVRTRLR